MRPRISSLPLFRQSLLKGRSESESPDHVVSLQCPWRKNIKINPQAAGECVCWTYSPNPILLLKGMAREEIQFLSSLQQWHLAAFQCPGLQIPHFQRQPQRGSEVCWLSRGVRQAPDWQQKKVFKQKEPPTINKPITFSCLPVSPLLWGAASKLGNIFLSREVSTKMAQNSDIYFFFPRFLHLQNLPKTTGDQRFSGCCLQGSPDRAVCCEPSSSDGWGRMGSGCSPVVKKICQNLGYFPKNLLAKQFGAQFGNRTWELYGIMAFSYVGLWWKWQLCVVRGRNQISQFFSQFLETFLCGDKRRLLSCCLAFISGVGVCATHLPHNFWLISCTSLRCSALLSQWACRCLYLNVSPWLRPDSCRMDAAKRSKFVNSSSWSL